MTYTFNINILILYHQTTVWACSTFILDATLKNELLLKTVSLLEGVYAPACLTDAEGSLIFANRPMESIINSASDIPFKCQWVSGFIENSCPDCAEYPVVEGRCFVSRDDEFRLVAAVRLAAADDALARIYSRQDGGVDNKLQKAINRLFLLCVEDNRPAALGRLSHSRLEAMRDFTRLHAFVNDIIILAGMENAVENRIDPKMIMPLSEPLILRNAITRIVCQLLSLRPKDQVVVSSLARKAAGDKPEILCMVFQMHTSFKAGKNMDSLLGAVMFRIRSYFSLLRHATGHGLAAPEIYHRGDYVEARFEISNCEQPFINPASQEFSSQVPLSAREMEIMEMIKFGYDNKSIASALEITEATVKQHLKSLYRKHGVRNRISLVFASWNK